MSFNSNSTAKAMEGKLEQMDRLYMQMAGILLVNPYCLEGNARKNEVIQSLILHLREKIARSKSGEDEKQPNRLWVIRLSVLVECFEEGENIEYARKVFEALVNLTEWEIKHIPEELQERALEISEKYLSH